MIVLAYILLYLALYVLSYKLNKVMVKTANPTLSWDNSDIMVNYFISLTLLISTLTLLIILTYNRIK